MNCVRRLAFHLRRQHTLRVSINLPAGSTPLPEALKKNEGFSVRFPNTEAILQAVIEIQSQAAPRISFREALMVFARHELRIPFPDRSSLIRLLAEEPVSPPLGRAVIQRFPDIAYLFTIDHKYTVRFPKPEAIRKAFKEFEHRNRNSYSPRTMRTQFAFKVFGGLEIGPAAIENLFQSEFVSVELAEAVLAKFPTLDFELQDVRTGRRKKLSPFQDMRKNGASYGLVSLNYFDEGLIRAIDRLLRSNSIAVKSIVKLSQADVADRLKNGLHFVVNACLLDDERANVREIFKLGTSHLISLLKRGRFREISNKSFHELNVAVVNRSPEHRLVSKLPLNQRRIWLVGDQSQSQSYEMLCDLLRKDICDIAIVNSHSVLEVDGELFTGPPNCPNTIIPDSFLVEGLHHEHCRQQPAMDLAVSRMSDLPSTLVPSFTISIATSSQTPEFDSLFQPLSRPLRTLRLQYLNQVLGIEALGISESVARHLDTQF